MAGFNVGGLPYFLQYQQQAQQQALQKQEADMRMQAFQQQNVDRQRQQAAMAAAGNALPQLLAQPPQQQPQPQFPPQQTPAPGQPSQPMMQPGQQPPPQGMPPPPQGAAPMPGQGAAGQVNNPPLPPGGVPPFRPMPTSPPPQQQAQPASIPAPPGIQAPQPGPGAAGGPLSIQSAIKVLQDQGLEGADLMAGLAQLQPVLDTHAKAQAAQLQTDFNNQLKIQQVQDRHDALEEKRREADQRAQDRSLDRADRLAARQDSLALRHEMVGIARERLALQGGGAGGGTPPADSGKKGEDGLPVPVGGGGLSGEAVRALAERQKAGDPSWSRGLSRPAIAAVNNDVAKMGVTGSDVAGGSIDYAAARKGAQAATQREANIATSEKAIINPGGLADQVLDAARKTYRTGSPALNQKINYVLANYTGDPAVIDLKNALGDLEGQFNKAMAGGGAATDTLRAEVHQRINDAQTIPQLEAAINRMKLGLRKEGEAAQEATKMYGDRVRESGKVGKKPEAPTKGPAVGTVEGGYRFKGGDPAQQSSWEKV